MLTNIYYYFMEIFIQTTFIVQHSFVWLEFRPVFPSSPTGYQVPCREVSFILTDNFKNIR